MESCRDALYPAPRNPSHVDTIDVARWDAFEAGWKARAALTVREEPPRFDEVMIGREEFEQIRRAQGFALFVAALDKSIAAKTRKTITLGRLIEKAKDALAGSSAAAREDTERPNGEHWTLWICNECGWTTATYPPYALCCSVEPHKNQSMTSIRVVRDIEQEQDQ